METGSENKTVLVQWLPPPRTRPASQKSISSRCKHCRHPGRSTFECVSNLYTQPIIALLVDDDDDDQVPLQDPQCGQLLDVLQELHDKEQREMLKFQMPFQLRAFSQLTRAVEERKSPQ